MDKEFIELQFSAFNKLCYKAQELAFTGLLNKNENMIRFISENAILTYLTGRTPIEQILYLSLILNKQDNEYIFEIHPQKSIKYEDKNYKVDFLVERVKPNKECKNYRILNYPIIVECDGFEFHSSKEQMNNDYKRENNLKSMGYNVIRFTGSQIFKEPEKCCELIYNLVKKAIDNEEYTEEIQ